ncbi:hypothetical protein ACV07N_08055 [Roseivirga echinicomitans]
MKDNFKPKLSYLAIFLMFSLFTGCIKEELEADFLIYENDFETNKIEGLTGERIHFFNGSNVIGNYNNDGFQLHLNDIPDHNYIHISFDLLLHDSWDGNGNGFENDFPDLWGFAINPDINLNKSDQYKFETTFSNTPCDSELCPWQSYPNNYPFLSIPKKGLKAKAPGLCLFSNRWDGTTVYRIQKTFRHTDKAIAIDFYDRLYQPNAPDEKCDESWSLDNLTVRALSIK